MNRHAVVVISRSCVPRMRATSKNRTRSSGAPHPAAGESTAVITESLGRDLAAALTRRGRCRSGSRGCEIPNSRGVAPSHANECSAPDGRSPEVTPRALVAYLLRHAHRSGESGTLWSSAGRLGGRAALPKGALRARMLMPDPHLHSQPLEEAVCRDNEQPSIVMRIQANPPREFAFQKIADAHRVMEAAKRPASLSYRSPLPSSQLGGTVAPTDVARVVSAPAQVKEPAHTYSRRRIQARMNQPQIGGR